MHDEDGAETKCMNTRKGQKIHNYCTRSRGIPLHSPKRFAEETPYTDDLVYATVDRL